MGIEKCQVKMIEHNLFISWTLSPTAKVSLFMQAFAFGRQDGRESLKTSEGGVAYPSTGSLSPHVTNINILPSVTGSLRAAANVKKGYKLGSYNA
jgi:hypothetical protein